MKNLVEKYIRKPALWIWDQVKTPLLLFCIFFISGFGLLQGMIVSSSYTGLISGKVLIITLVDLGSEDE